MPKSVSSRLYGAHVSVSGGIANAIRNGQQLGCTAIQLHPAPPQRWNTKPFAAGIEDEFVSLRKDSEIRQVFFHGIYLINLANPDPQQAHLSKSSLLHYLDLQARIGGDGVIFHVGSMKHQSEE